MTDAVEKMLETAYRLADLGLSPGASGNISCKIGDTIYLSGTGTSFSMLTRNDLSILKDGEVTGPKPTGELGFHVKDYERNPAATAVVHTHSPAATAVSCLNTRRPYHAIPPITPYVFMRVGNLPYVPHSYPGSPELFASIDEIKYPYDAVMLANHGIITSGSLLQAEQACIEMENVAGLHLQLLGQDVNRLTEEPAAKWNRPWNTTDYRKATPVA